MALNHGINAYKGVAPFLGAESSKSGIPYYVGYAPVHKGNGFSGLPLLITDFEQAKKEIGYSDAWRDTNGSPKWNLCQAVYAHFKLFGIGPILVFNVFNPTTDKTAVAAETKTVTDHRVILSDDVLINSNLVVKASASAQTALVKGTDYEAFYEDSSLVIELISGSASFNAQSLSISCDKVNPTAFTTTVNILNGISDVELCRTVTGVVPDLLAAPGFSKNRMVSDVLATKAQNINEVFKAKAVVDIDSSAAGAPDVTSLPVKAEAVKDENIILCWLSGVAGDKLFDMSVLACCCMERNDLENGNIPSDSPSNRSIPITGLVNDTGAQMYITLPQADTVSYTCGVVSAINNDGFVLWGNLMSTGMGDGIEDVSKAYICTARMHDFICNEFVKTYLKYVDRGKTKIQADNIVTRFNAWLNGLIGDGKILAGEVTYNPAQVGSDSLMSGSFKLHSRFVSPVPMQNIEMFSEFDVNMLNSVNG